MFLLHSKPGIVVLVGLLKMILLLMVPAGEATLAPNSTSPSVPNLSVPSVFVCQPIGSTVTITVTASSVAYVTAWQVRLALTGFAVLEQTPGITWTSASYPHFTANRTDEEGTLFGFTFLNDASLSHSGPVTLLTVTLGILSASNATYLHIGNASDGQLFTKLLSPHQTTQTYTATDGSASNCFNGPIPSFIPKTIPSATIPPVSTRVPSVPSPTPPSSVVYCMELGCALNALPGNTTLTSDFVRFNPVNGTDPFATFNAPTRGPATKFFVSDCALGPC